MEASAMASSSSSETEETSSPLVGAVVPAPDAKDDLDAAAAIAAYRAEFDRRVLEYTELMASIGAYRPRPKRWFPRLRRLWLLFLVRVHPSSIRFPPDEPLDPEDIDILMLRDSPSAWKKLAMDRQRMQDCLDHYNRLNPDNEYEPVFGNVSRIWKFHNGICWTHGNFIARKKSFGRLLSFLLAPRAVFFYELAYINGFSEVITCTPVEEPAYYTALGFPLWLARVSSAKLESDSFCKTCHCRFGVPRAGIQKMNACGHNNVANVCEMCCHRGPYTWHPDPGEFAFGYHHPYRPDPTRH